jgi:DNA-binding transcriptional MerR regulator
MGPEQAVTVLRVIKAAQRLGFTLDEVADLLAATQFGHRRPDAGLQGRAAAKLTEVDDASGRPRRHEHYLVEAGRGLVPVLMALMARDGRWATRRVGRGCVWRHGCGAVFSSCASARRAENR